MANLTLDLMEYSTDTPAQAAYVSNAATYTTDRIPTMSSNTAPSGVVSASSELYPAWKAMNDTNVDESDSWIGNVAPSVGSPHYLQYQFTSVKIITRYTVTTRNHIYVASPKDWKLQGSNNGTTWTDLDTQTSQFAANTANTKATYTITNSNSYLYYRILITSRNGTEEYVAIGEFELMETILQCYSEATIKTQGIYSLKAVALITDSLNKTFTRTISPTFNLSRVKNLKFDIRASRTGSNIKIGIRDSGGVTTEITPIIITANTFQTVSWDLSSVSDENKDVINQIIITIINADAQNIFYLDWFEIATCIDVFGMVG